MSTYYFTNRRRAKDTIMLLVDEHVSDGVTVFVRDSIVYLDIEKSVTEGKLAQSMSAILHYAESAQESIENLLQLDKITELYKADGLAKFKV
ncbi:MAG: hypothetical protein WCY09_10190 [Candidatus Omnitrophota bacterium]|jgi:hypothetical protein